MAQFIKLTIIIQIFSILICPENKQAEIAEVIRMEQQQQYIYIYIYISATANAVEMFDPVVELAEI